MARKFAFDAPDAAIQALAKHLSVVSESERLNASQCTGRVLAEHVVADRDSPASDVSAMDGYAIRLLDLRAGSRSRSAAKASPVTHRRKCSLALSSEFSRVLLYRMIAKRSSNAKTPRNWTVPSDSGPRPRKRNLVNIFDVPAKMRRPAASYSQREHASLLHSWRRWRILAAIKSVFTDRSV